MLIGSTKITGWLIGISKWTRAAVLAGQGAMLTYFGYETLRSTVSSIGQNQEMSRKCGEDFDCMKQAIVGDGAANAERLNQQNCAFFHQLERQMEERRVQSESDSSLRESYSALAAEFEKTKLQFTESCSAP